MHTNNGGHLSEGIVDDATQKARWRDLLLMILIPGDKVGRQLVQTLSVELRRVWERRWNAERLILFQTVIPQRARHVSGVQAIGQHIRERLETWEADHHQMMV